MTIYFIVIDKKNITELNGKKINDASKNHFIENLSQNIEKVLKEEIKSKVHVWCCRETNRFGIRRRRIGGFSRSKD